MMLLEKVKAHYRHSIPGTASSIMATYLNQDVWLRYLARRCEIRRVKYSRRRDRHRAFRRADLRFAREHDEVQEK